MNIDTYMRALRDALAGFGPMATRPLSESYEHLCDSAQTLTEAGTPAAEADLEAVRRFGDVQENAAKIAVELSRLRTPAERILKILAISTMFTAVWGLAAVAIINPRPELLAATGVVCSATVFAAVAAMRRSIEAGTLIVSAVALIAAGFAAFFWALAGTRAGHEPQVGQALLTAAYIAQGVLALWVGNRRRSNDPHAEGWR